MQNNTPLTNDDIRRIAPAVFATKPNPKVSSRYGFISTVDVLDNLRSSGWQPVRARQSYTRHEDNRPFTRHEIVLRRPEAKPVLKLGDLLTEIRLINSHGTESCYHTLGGLYRLACTNGMVASAGSNYHIKVRHTIYSIQGVVDAVTKIGDELPKLVDTAEQWSQIQLTEAQQTELGRQALSLRYDDQDKWPTTPAVIALSTRRQSDAGSDLWHTFNRVQENITRNGAVFKSDLNRSSTGRVRSIRSVKSIDADIRINQKLWEAASNLALSA